jgi:hypothetical protein
MSTKELRKAATRMAHLDAKFEKDIVAPTSIQGLTLKSGMALAEVFPGGDWIITLHEDSTLHLNRTMEFDGPPVVTVKRPDNFHRYTRTLSYDALFLSFLEGEHIAVVSEPFW